MIALDSSSIICLLERIEPARQAIVNLLNANNSPLVASTVTLTECLNLPTHKLSWRDDYLRFFESDELQLAAVDISIAKRAADIRIMFGLKTTDAIHLATALAHGAETFFTTDNQDFSRCAGKVDIEIVVIPRISDARPNTP